MEQTSEISSLADSGEENIKSFPASPSTARKRKRSSFEQESASDQGLLLEPSINATKKYQNNAAVALVGHPSPSESAGEFDHEIVVDTNALPAEQKQSQESREPALTQQRYQRGKRKERQIRDDEPEDKYNGFISEGGPAKHEENQEAVYSNEEDCENDDTGDVPGAEISVKNEEGGIKIFKAITTWTLTDWSTVLQKKSAYYSLNAMEKFFATFRDK